MSLPLKLNIFFVVALLAASFGLQTAMTAVYAADFYVGVSNGGSEDGSEANPYSTIMAAINHSAAGDTVRVTPGVYYENVVMKDGVDLIGTDPTTTIIDAGGNGSVVETSNDATLSGFTLRNGTIKW
jgi:pectin methylesterase-like acyl-CoA thioesterase